MHFGNCLRENHNFTYVLHISYMQQHIEQFPRYLAEWYNIGSHIDLTKIQDFSYESIVFVGMWWSGMALSVMKTLTDLSSRSVPSQVVKTYTVPHWVNEKTLMICASYSWNTEETVSAMQDALEKWATMIALTSWWILQQFAHDAWHICAQMPTGIEPRAALPYSFGIQLAIMEKLWLIEEDVHETIGRFDTRSEEHTDQVIVDTSAIAQSIATSFPFFYTTDVYSSVALRAQQQIQENGRMQCHHHILPEHNHNELLWRQEKNERVQVVWIDDAQASVTDPNNALRAQLTKEVLAERDVPQHQILLRGSTVLQKICTGIYQIDRLSLFVSQDRWVDPNGSELIEWFKGELKKRR